MAVLGSHAAGCGAGGEGVGVSGWMADFGEYLPADEDVVLWSGAAASRVHNDWPRMWAQVGRPRPLSPPAHATHHLPTLTTGKSSPAAAAAVPEPLPPPSSPS